MLWAPAKRVAKPSDSRAALAAAAAQEYEARFKEVLSQAGTAEAPVGMPLMFHSWRCFLGRWMGALSAAAAQSGSAPEQVSPLMTLVSAFTACLLAPLHQARKIGRRVIATAVQRFALKTLRRDRSPNKASAVHAYSAAHFLQRSSALRPHTERVMCRRPGSRHAHRYGAAYPQA